MYYIKAIALNFFKKTIINNLINTDIIKIRDTRPLDMAIGLSMYGSTLYFLSNSMLLITLGLLMSEGLQRSYRRPELLLVIIFSLLAYLNILTHANEFEWSKHFSGLAVILVALSAMLSPNIRVSAMRVFVICVCIETLVACFEYISGISPLCGLQDVPTDIGISDLLYNKRAFGLSNNSSVLAEKIFISIIIFFSIKNSFSQRILIFLTLISGLYVSFNRTAIISTAFYLIFTNISIRITLRHVIIGIGLSTILISLWDEIIMQFMRGNISELSGSELQWLDFLQTAIGFISDHFFLGNGSLTFRLEDTVNDQPQHLHNSFLMLLVTHGVFVSLFLLLYVGCCINAANKSEVCAFLVFSLTQYFVFWNLSTADIILFWLLGKQSDNKRANMTTQNHINSKVNNKTNYN